MPTEQFGPVIGYSKDFRYDFRCCDASGVVFIVELQKYYEKAWFKRCVSYASRVYDRQNRRGEEYDVPPVYLIGLMGIEVSHERPELWKDRYVSEYTFREKMTGELQEDTIFIIFAELRRFDRKLSECRDDLEKMLYIVKNGWRLQKQPRGLRAEIFTRLFQACDIPRFDEAKRIKYEKDMFDERRYNGEIKAARKEGREEGREEGKNMAKMEDAKKLKELGVDVTIIAQATGLAVEEIERL